MEVRLFITLFKADLDSKLSDLNPDKPSGKVLVSAEHIPEYLADTPSRDIYCIVGEGICGLVSRDFLKNFEKDCPLSRIVADESPVGFFPLDVKLYGHLRELR